MAATGVQFWVNGPTYLYVGTGSAGALQKLGFTERGVHITLMGHHVPVFSDDLGPESPRDVSFMADDAFIRFDLNQFDETVWRQCVARLWNSTNQAIGAGNLAAPGYLDAKDPGSLMSAEGYTFRLLVYAPYSVKSAYTGLNSHNFLNAYLEGQVDTGPLGTQVKKNAGVFHAIQQKQTNGTWKLYDNVTTGFVWP